MCTSMNRDYVAALALCLLAAPASAEMYKWTDEDGKVHYSDQPPPADAQEQKPIKAVKPRKRGSGGRRPPPRRQARCCRQGQDCRRAGDGVSQAPRGSGRSAKPRAQKDAEAAEEKKRNCAARHTRRWQRCSAAAASRQSRPNGEQIYHERRRDRQGARERQKGSRLAGASERHSACVRRRAARWRAAGVPPSDLA